jgi:5-formaminoimidazole-4-carboxamide-1-(beta)-D-ribofuranosyl 5'-monophosphate synthetase
VPGTYFNLNFFVSPLTGETEFLGIERRLQTNIHDIASLPARQQMEIDIQIQNIEVGHTPASIRESLLEKIFEMGDRIAIAVRKEYPPGIIGPIMATTSPYTKYYYGQTMGVGRRIAMEVKNAMLQGKLSDIVT